MLLYLLGVISGFVLFMGLGQWLAHSERVQRFMEKGKEQHEDH